MQRCGAKWWDGGIRGEKYFSRVGGLEVMGVLDCVLFGCFPGVQFSLLGWLNAGFQETLKVGSLWFRFLRFVVDEMLQSCRGRGGMKELGKGNLWVGRALVVGCWVVFGFTAVQERWSNVGFRGFVWWWNAEFRCFGDLL